MGDVKLGVVGSRKMPLFAGVQYEKETHGEGNAEVQKGQAGSGFSVRMSIHYAWRPEAQRLEDLGVQCPLLLALGLNRKLPFMLSHGV
jgi:hypothetical protein